MSEKVVKNMLKNGTLDANGRKEVESRNENNDRSRFHEKISGGGAKHHESRNVLLDIISPFL